MLTDVIPELKEFLGEQNELTETTPTEARYRLQNAFARFVRGVATKERPLVMFLDDLQWADLPSIDLIASLASDPELAHVLVIGAYRSNEIDKAHRSRRR
ncbi:MAG: AAA family ATPase [Polyangiales bacterium]